MPVLLTSLLAGCQGLFGGDDSQRIPLQGTADGRLQVSGIHLTPDMNPVTLNFIAEFASGPAEAGQWNRYRVELQRDGRTQAETAFNVNSPAHADSGPTAPGLRHTLLRINVPEAADYAVIITPTRPVGVTLLSPQLEIRQHVR